MFDPSYKDACSTSVRHGGPDVRFEHADGDAAGEPRHLGFGDDFKVLGQRRKSCCNCSQWVTFCNGSQERLTATGPSRLAEPELAWTRQDAKVLELLKSQICSLFDFRCLDVGQVIENSRSDFM